MDQTESVCYVWSEYALNVRPSELAALLDNPRVRTAASKTRCNVLFTRRVLNRRQQTSEWTRYSIVRITGPDDQSISQCNRLLEQAIPGYQYRKDYPRRAPVTLYSRNVEAEGDFRSRFGDAVLKKRKKRGLSESDTSRISGKPWQEDESRAISVRSQIEHTGPGSFVVDTSARIQVNRDPLSKGSSQIKLETHISSRSSNSEDHVTVSSQSIEVSNGMKSAQVVNKLTVGNVDSAQNRIDLASQEGSVAKNLGSLASSISEGVGYPQQGKSQNLTQSVDSSVAIPSMDGALQRAPGSHISFNMEVDRSERQGDKDVGVRAVMATQISLGSTGSAHQSEHSQVGNQMQSDAVRAIEPNKYPVDLGSSYAGSLAGFSFQPAPPVCECGVKMVAEHSENPGELGSVNESTSFRAVTREESSVNRDLRVDDVSQSAAHISIELSFNGGESAAKSSVHLSQSSAQANVATEPSRSNFNGPADTSAMDIVVAVSYKDHRSDPDNGAFKMDNVMAVPLAHSGLDETTTSNMGSKANLSLSASSATKEPSLNLPIRNTSSPATDACSRGLDIVPTDSRPVCTCGSPTGQSADRPLAMRAQQADSSDAHLVLNESRQFVGESKGVVFETHTAVQLSMYREASEELINIGEPNIRHVQDTTKQTTGARPQLPTSPTAGNEHRDAAMSRLATSPALQPTSPVSVATSISTNLEVHVNRETGQIDVSFAVNGTPVPGVCPDENTAPVIGPSFSAEWNVKLERNAVFGPIGFISSNPQSPVSPNQNATAGNR